MLTRARSLSAARSNAAPTSAKRSTGASREFEFGPHVSPPTLPAHRPDLQDFIMTGFCYRFLEFSPRLALRLPGGPSFDFMKYWDGQPFRFSYCERNRGEQQQQQQPGAQPWGATFWCVSIERVDDDNAEGSDHVD